MHLPKCCACHTPIASLCVLLDGTFPVTPCSRVLPANPPVLTPLQPKLAFASNAIDENVMFLSLAEVICKSRQQRILKEDKEVHGADGNTVVTGRLWRTNTNIIPQ